MRVTYVAAGLIAVAAVPPETLRAIAAASASVLVEAMPLLLAGALLSCVLPPAAAAFAGCGCSPGPSARSIPAAVAVGLVFGPLVAAGRVLAGVAVAASFHARPEHARSGECEHCEPAGVLAQLQALVPAAVAAAAAQQFGAFVLGETAIPIAQFCAGAAFGAIAAPCGLGTAALAASLHTRAPFLAAGLLCTAGILDVRACSRVSHRAGHDALGYALLAVALAVAGLRCGAGLVHPAIGATLLPCAAGAAYMAARFRERAARAMRVAPAIVLIGVFGGTAPPQYRATETTAGEFFAGERLLFTGTLSRHDVIQRYAITCCRADAMPVAIRLSRALPFRDDTWLRAEGNVAAARDGTFLLNATDVRPVPAPQDPFIYR
jgi:hypothetical protein